VERHQHEKEEVNMLRCGMSRSYDKENQLRCGMSRTYDSEYRPRCGRAREYVDTTQGNLK
jgi:hypothetical protein